MKVTGKKQLPIGNKTDEIVDKSIDHNSIVLENK
jgi:hypothetical protein